MNAASLLLCCVCVSGIGTKIGTWMHPNRDMQNFLKSYEITGKTLFKTRKVLKKLPYGSKSLFVQNLAQDS